MVYGQIKFRDVWLEKGNNEYRNSSKFEMSAVKAIGTRHCTSNLFALSWLCESTSKVYCFPCKLLSDNESVFTTGFNRWKHGDEGIQSHSKSEYRTSLAAAIIRSKTSERVDKALIKDMEIKYRRSVVTRLIDVIMSLCEKGLAICGKNEIIGSVHNGNYLGILELLSKYDSYLERHIEKYGNKGSGCTSYLSHDICEEIIQIVADVLKMILVEVRESKCF